MRLCLYSLASAFQSIVRAKRLDTAELFAAAFAAPDRGCTTAHDHGADGVFASMYEQCFKRQIEKYTYEVCAFGRASQLDVASKMSLGLFDGFAANFSSIRFTNVRTLGLNSVH
jgi:hypothetical protein